MRDTCGAHASPAVPSPPGWVHWPEPACRKASALGIGETHGYDRGKIRVLSSAIMAEYHDLVVAQNHVSVSVLMDRRPNDLEMTMVRGAFDMVDAEEDNHQPGRIRNLFLPLHLPRGTTGICDCKSDETVVVEPDGFRWSKAHS